MHLWMEECEGHGGQQPSAFVGQGTQAGQIAVEAPDDCGEHDCDHCAICQHHFLGQLFIAAPPAEIVLAVCDLLSAHAPEAIVCPAHFSVAQPRAPPVV